MRINDGRCDKRMSHRVRPEISTISGAAPRLESTVATGSKTARQLNQIRSLSCSRRQCTGNSGCFPRVKRAAIVRRYPVFSCVQGFHVSVIHRTPTWTTGSLTYVRSYACVYKRGCGTPTTSQHTILTWKNSHKFVLCSGHLINI